MDSFKTFLKNYKWYLIGGIVLLILIFTIIISLVKNYKVNVEDDVEVEFNGYQKTGTAHITEKSEDKVEKKLFLRALKQSNFKNKEILNMIKNNELEDIDEDNLNYTEFQQFKHASKMMDNVDFDIYNSENLSNGDKVKVQLKIEKGVSKEYKLKAKEFTKEFKVKGLKKPKKLSAKTLIENLNPKFTGVNGSGTLNLISKDTAKSLSNLSLSNYEFTVPNNGNLKNGDKIEIKIPQKLIDDINESGSNTFKGNKNYTIKVDDLTNLNKVENIDQVLNKNNHLIKEKYSNSKYTKYNIENLDNYYKVSYGQNSDSFFDNDKEVNEKVSPMTSIEPTNITLVTTFKINESSKYSDPETKYSYTGYKNYKLEDNRLVKDEETDKKDSSSSKDELKDLDEDLKGDNFKKL
ncbi:hypothetical protein [Staphylococcus epidermidis]|uniref:hypothetical protein n=1 Tax=Staphylococcus epidermidis TaxID=1282 RepID=UPI000B7A3883|nr:hypothetical protein [Staphylococcus epidermidis]OXE82173.1 hypothetical protein ATC33_11845 [Staphylococcus epidermidis]